VALSRNNTDDCTQSRRLLAELLLQLGSNIKPESPIGSKKRKRTTNNDGNIDNFTIPNVNKHY